MASGTCDVTITFGDPIILGAIDYFPLDDGIQLFQGANGRIAVPSATGVTSLIERPAATYRVRVANATGSALNQQLTGYRPMNTHITRIAYRRTAGTGAFQVGTTSGGSQIVASTSQDSGIATLASTGFSATQANLFIQVAANTTYEFTISYERLAPL